MRRAHIRRLFKRHRGSMKRVAGEIGFSAVSVSKWLMDQRRNSERIEIAVLKEAQKLLAIEAETAAARKSIQSWLAGNTDCGLKTHEHGTHAA
jgi:transcriptional regulator with XRE-family HTH domain